MNILLKRDGMVLGMLMCFFSVMVAGFMMLAALTSGHVTAGRYSIRSSQALYLAEAAVAQAKRELRQNFGSIPPADQKSAVALGAGEYRFRIEATALPDVRRVTGYGAVPGFKNPRAMRTVQITLTKLPIMVPADLKSAIFAVKDVNGGDSYEANLKPAEFFTGRIVAAGWSELPTREQKPLDFGGRRM